MRGTHACGEYVGTLELTNVLSTGAHPERVQIARVLACTYMPTYEVPEIVVAGTYSVVKWLMKCAGAWHVSRYLKT